MDWRLPSPLKDKLLSNGKFGSNEEELLRLVDSKADVVHCGFQSHDHGADYYDTNKKPNERSFAHVTRDTW